MTPQRSPVPPSPKRRHHNPSSTPSTAGAVSLPDEIIFDILTRVPVKSACRFRCVSGEWCALISGPDFVAAHKSRGHAEPLVAVYSFRGKGTELRLVGTNGGVVRVIQDGGGARKLSGGDLICVVSEVSGARVVEPVTGDVLVTCPGPDTSPWDPLSLSTWRGVCRLANVAFGLGRAAPSAEYKLVRLIDCVSCEVRAMKGGGGWRPAPSPPVRVTCTSSCVAVVNGVLHALGSREGDRNVYCFDLESEKWMTTMQGPQIEGGYKLWMDTRMFEINATLCVVHQSKARLTDIWLLTDPTKGIWAKAYAIPMGRHIQLYTPLGMTHDGEKLLFQCSFYHKRGQAVRIYDPCTNTWTDVMEQSNAYDCRIFLRNFHLGSFLSAKTLRTIDIVKLSLNLP